MVGSAFLKLIIERSNYVAEHVHANIKIVGLLNRQKMIFDESGIDLNNWKEILQNSKLKSNIEKFIDRMKEKNLPNSILVDCTANDSVVNHYTKILSSSISIVTPNKIANTQSYEQFVSLRETAGKHNVQFRYGTNVGSALPFINTLKDIISNGDQVTKIEGVFSGTLSFIFNTLKRERQL